MAAPSEVDWKNVVDLIRRGDATGEELLYTTLHSGARLFLRRRLEPRMLTTGSTTCS